MSATLDQLPPRRRLLIVDDASPDGTGAIADDLAAADGDVGVLHRSRKEGLGPAYLAGFREAIADGAEVVAQMDADLSHDPADLRSLLAALETSDLVLGSRYVERGGIENWGRARQTISRCGSAYARAVLGLDVRDLTGGYKVFRSEVLEVIDLASISSLGYAFQVETTYRAIRAGFRVREVPITFRNRQLGQSKMTAGVAFEAAWRIPSMRVRPRTQGRTQKP